MTRAARAVGTSRMPMLVLACALVLGSWFRFAALGEKVYWVDEAYSSLQLAGYTEDQLVREVVARKLTSFGDLDRYQRVDSRSGLADGVEVTIREHPEHPPLYYALAWAWARSAGSSVLALRSLSAAIGVLEISATYWLGLELFESAATAAIGAMLVALSPLFVLYSQEVREYSLWTLTILMSTGLLARALRRDRASVWVLYAIAVAAGLYTHLYFVYVSAAHVLGAAIHERARPTRRSIRCLAATAAAWIAWAPWLSVVVANAETIRRSISWQSHHIALPDLLDSWAANLARVFVDSGVEVEAAAWRLGTTLPATVAIAALFAYALWFLASNGSRIAVSLLFPLSASTLLPLAIGDLTLGGVRSISARYMIPSFLALLVVLAHLLGAKLRDDASRAQVRAWQAVILVVAVSALASDVQIARARTWWTKVDSNQNVPLAEIINRTERPLVISDVEATRASPRYRRIGNLLSLSHLLRPDVGLLLLAEPEIASLPEGFTDVFLFLPSRQLRAAFESKQHVKLVCLYRDHWDSWLWKPASTAMDRS